MPATGGDSTLTLYVIVALPPGATVASDGVVALVQVIVRVAAFQMPPEAGTVPPSAIRLPPASTGSVPAGRVSTTTTSWAGEKVVPLWAVALTVKSTIWP